MTEGLDQVRLTKRLVFNKIVIRFIYLLFTSSKMLVSAFKGRQSMKINLSSCKNDKNVGSKQLKANILEV